MHVFRVGSRFSYRCFDVLEIDRLGMVTEMFTAVQEQFVDGPLNNSEVLYNGKYCAGNRIRL